MQFKALIQIDQISICSLTFSLQIDKKFIFFCSVIIEKWEKGNDLNKKNRKLVNVCVCKSNEK